jgi:hypothetical protein
MGVWVYGHIAEEGLLMCARMQLQNQTVKKTSLNALLAAPNAKRQTLNASFGI